MNKIIKTGNFDLVLNNNLSKEMFLQIEQFSIHLLVIMKILTENIGV